MLIDDWLLAISHMSCDHKSWFVITTYFQWSQDMSRGHTTCLVIRRQVLWSHDMFCDSLHPCVVTTNHVSWSQGISRGHKHVQWSQHMSRVAMAHLRTVQWCIVHVQRSDSCWTMSWRTRSVCRFYHIHLNDLYVRARLQAAARAAAKAAAKEAKAAAKKRPAAKAAQRSRNLKRRR